MQCWTQLDLAERCHVHIRNPDCKKKKEIKKENKVTFMSSHLSYRYDNSHLYSVTKVRQFVYFVDIKLQHNNTASSLLVFHRECGIREQSVQDIQLSCHLRPNANVSDFLWAPQQVGCQVCETC